MALLQTRHWTSGIATATVFLTMYVSTQSFKYLEHYLNMSYMYMMYVGFCVVLGVFTMAFVPETKGKSNEEMARLYQNK